MDKNRGESFSRKTETETEKRVESRELAEKLGEIAIKEASGEGLASRKDVNKHKRGGE